MTAQLIQPALTPLLCLFNTDGLVQTQQCQQLLKVALQPVTRIGGLMCIRSMSSM